MNKDNYQKIAVIGGGLAGSEACWQLAKAGIKVTLWEMKPHSYSPAHKNPDLAELVCSNSLRSRDINSAVGLLKQEMLDWESLIIQTAQECSVPADKALAVDREKFSRRISQILEEHPLIDIKREEVTSLNDKDWGDYDRVIVATGPLAAETLADELARTIGEEQLYFYDALAPIVTRDSLDLDQMFWASRHDPERKDYLNIPLNKEQYQRFHGELVQGKKIPFKKFEKEVHFEGCMPIESLAERGEKTPLFGPLKPIGLQDPRSGERPYAVIQLRPEDQEKTMFNLVGFQTKLTFPEQKRIFRLLPGLENAEFVRLGSMHRNTFVNSPRVLTPYLEIQNKPGFYLAGQITGVEGYVESAACGLWLARYLAGQTPDLPPEETAIGALLKHLHTPKKNFQPMNVNFGLMPPLSEKVKKKDKKARYTERARQVWQEWQ